MREEEHLQECRELIAENIRRYEAQVEERHRQTQELVKAVQSGNVELYDQMFTSQSLEEHSRNQLAHNKAAYEKPFFGRIDYRNLDERLHESIYIGYTEKIVIPNSLPEPNLLRTSFQEFGITFLSLAVFPMQKCFEYH